MKLETMRELLLDELQDLYSAETQITKALPKMAKTSTSPELKQAFESHLQETEGHVQRLEKIFKHLQESSKGKTCEGMKGLLKEGEERIKDGGEPEVVDAGLIAAAQRVEHYEIAAYGSVRTYAELLKESDVANLLEQTLAEEKSADQKLTKISTTVNRKAKAA
ncbi:ferritin-like domain-containing protein [Alloacidobacterium dinghuense]|uniref:Ferritin-like domain-containing protein n=1 Tax=Alloacidobacterium dinghuense TaxID=2763107 RepID=A0A7G8BDS5_9BACT|nr:ferritin-like domain-containing protein [Alloacidobacterium dinghuense]QNI30695.1 ferritin-like domain-containing protein [Alloacidobacterium dinghuense]